MKIDFVKKAAVHQKREDSRCMYTPRSTIGMKLYLYFLLSISSKLHYDCANIESAQINLDVLSFQKSHSRYYGEEKALFKLKEENAHVCVEA